MNVIDTRLPELLRGERSADRLEKRFPDAPLDRNAPAPA
jgi:hypothetical protein